MAEDISTLVMKVTSNGIKEGASDLDKLTTSAGKAEVAVKRLATATAEAEVQARRTNGTNVIYTESSSALTRAIQMLSTATAQSSAATLALSQRMENLNVNTNRATNSIRMNNESMREAHAAARGLAGSLGVLWTTYGNFTGMAVGLAIGASLKGIVTIGKDVEHTLEGIRVRGNETVESVNAIRESVMELGKGVYGPQQVANAFETLVLAGLNAKQAVSSISAALNLATVGGVSIEKAATTLVSVGTAIGYTAEGFGRVGDVIAKTAALSMSSVETLSEAFKSASSVNRLYGVSLEDIGTSLGVLSNLGIQGSAAGTALKNFYKELSSDSDKVKNTLKDIGLSSASFKDSAGNFKPLLEVVSILDGGLKKLSESQQKTAQSNLSNERGQRLMTQLLGEYNITVGESSNALAKFRENVDNSYGFAAKGAVQLALTAKSQIDSMMNSLKTSFAETFANIQPEIIEFSTRMKGVFASREFKEGLAVLAQSFASLAITIAQNVPLIVKFVEGLILLKVALAIVPVLQSMPAIITALSTAFYSVVSALTALAAGTLTWSAAFPPLLILIGLAIAAITTYNLLKGGEEADKASKNAAAYSRGYVEGLIKESENLDKINTKLREKKTLAEANAEIERDASRQKMTDLDNAAVAEAKANFEKTKGNFDPMASLKALQALNKAREVQANNSKLAAAAEATLFEKAKQNKLLVEAAAAASRKQAQDEPEAKLSAKVDKAGENATYNAALKEVQGRIDSVKRQLAYEEGELQSKYKQGILGEIALIQGLEAAEVKAAKTTMTLLQEKLAKASGKDKGPVMQEVENARIQTLEKEEQATKNSTQKQAEYYSTLADKNLKTEAAALAAQGQNAKAYEMLNKAKYDKATDQLMQDLALTSDAEKKMQIERQIAFQDITYQAELQSAQVKDAATDFDLLYATISNDMKGVQTAAENDGLGAIGMFRKAQDASVRYAEMLPLLAKAMKAVQDAAASGTPADMAKAQEELGKMKALAEKHKTMWAGVGQSISKSLTGAFGKYGKAANDMWQINKKYGEDDNKSLVQKANYYGDMAGAASGFFDTQSKGYKTLQMVSQAFHLAEIAMEVKSNVVKAIGAVLNQAKGDPYTAFARMAAMAAVVAAIGVAVGGIGGGSSADTSKAKQEATGTGSVFGDDKAKSSSISNSLAILEKNSGLGLAHTSQMVDSLRTIAGGISGLANVILRTYGIKDGKVEGVTEGTKINKMYDIASYLPIVGGFVSKAIASQFSTKISVKDQGITADAKTLDQIDSEGLTAKSYADINTKKKAFGLSYSNKDSRKENTLDSETSNQFTMVVKSLRDGVVAAADVLGMSGGVFKAKLQTFVADIGDISVKGLTGEEVQKQLEAAFSKMGDDMAKWAGLGFADSDLAKVGEGAFETLMRLANDFQQVTDVMNVLGKTMTKTGIEGIRFSEDLIKAAGSLENLTSGTKAFVDGFFTEAEKMAPVTKSVQEVMQSLGMASVDTMGEFKAATLAALDGSAAGNILYNQLLAIAPAFKASAEYAEDLALGIETLTKAQQRALDISNKQRELEIALMFAQGRAAQGLAAQREDELAALKKLSPTLIGLQKEIYVWTDSQSKIQAAYDKEHGEMDATVKRLSTLSQSFKDFNASLELGAMSTATPLQKYEEARRQFESTLSLAKTGDVTAQNSLTKAETEFLNASRIVNSSSDAYQNDFKLVKETTDQMATWATTQVDVGKASLEALDKQVSGLIKIDDSVMSVVDAIRELDANLALIGVTRVDGSHAGGLSYVPTDGYIAELHKGERVLTAPEASKYNSGDDLKDVMVALLEEVAALRADQERQTDKQIEAAFIASDDNAGKIKQGVKEAAKDKVWAAKNEQEAKPK
jgi:TP901 family phage tail tape measure protein